MVRRQCTLEDSEKPLLFRFLYYFRRRECLSHFFINASYSKSSLDFSVVGEANFYYGFIQIKKIIDCILIFRVVVPQCRQSHRPHHIAYATHSQYIEGTYLSIVTPSFPVETKSSCNGFLHSSCNPTK